MKRILYLFTLLFSCSQQQNDLFCLPALQDSLETFISCIDSIPNPYNAPTIVNVNIEVSAENDTLVSFVAHYGFVYPVDNNMKMIGQTYGGIRIDSTIVVVHSDSIETVKDLINMELLDLDEEEYDFFKQYNGPSYDVSIPPLSRRGYLIQSGILTEYERRRGKYEK